MEFQTQLENLRYGVAERHEVIMDLRAGVFVENALEAEVEEYDRAVEGNGGPVDCN
jgi:hypothetical protein